MRPPIGVSGINGELTLFRYHHLLQIPCVLPRFLIKLIPADLRLDNEERVRREGDFSLMMGDWVKPRYIFQRRSMKKLLIEIACIL